MSNMRLIDPREKVYVVIQKDGTKSVIHDEIIVRRQTVTTTEQSTAVQVDYLLKKVCHGKWHSERCVFPTAEEAFAAADSYNDEKC